MPEKEESPRLDFPPERAEAIHRALLSGLLGNVGAKGETHEYAEEILYSAERAAALTGQLLAFSRRQVVQPRVLDLNEAVHNMHRFLKRILGEHIDIGMDSMAPYVALIQEKKLRGLAIAGAARWPPLPDVPTVAESGFPGFEQAPVLATLRKRVWDNVERTA